MVGFAIIITLFCGCAQKTQIVEPKKAQCKEQCFKSLELGENYRPIM
jgi:hypothetical protein